jgi:hypothetical protein
VLSEVSRVNKKTKKKKEVYYVDRIISPKFADEGDIKDQDDVHDPERGRQKNEKK